MWARVLLGCSLCLACHREAPRVTSPTASDSAERAPALDPAGRLSDEVRPLAYDLTLDIVPASDTFRGRVQIELELARATTALALHAERLTFESARVSRAGAERPIVAAPRFIPSESGAPSSLVVLDLPEPVGPGRARLEIEYAGRFDQHLRGLYKVQARGKPYAFTQFEAIDARQAFPCFDEPRFKTPFDIRLRVPVELVAVSNTAVTSEQPGDGGLREVTFRRTEPLPTYLVAFAVGPFDVVEAAPIAASAGRPRALPLRGVAAEGRGAELGFALSETPALLASLERYFGVGYPYDKLDLIAVPDFASGAMENAGAITFRDTLLLLGDGAPEAQRRASVSVNAHELAHQWFGNLVTMPWWDDIWLNEGFATWLAARVVDDVHPENNAGLARLATLERAFDVDSKATARQVRQPIASEHDIRNAFDAITYTKGGALLAMFERYLGAEAFRAGLALYLDRHRFGTATSADLLAALEESSRKPVAAAFTSFLDQPGVPRVSAQLRCSEQGPARVRLEQRRYVPLGSRAPAEGLWQVPVCLRYGGRAGDASGGEQSAGAGAAPKEQCTLLTAAQAEIELSDAGCPGWVIPNAHAAGYYRWALGAADLEALLARGYAALGTGERLSLLSNAEAAARAGELSFERLVAVTRRAAQEPARELVQAALDLTSRLRHALVGPAERAGYQRFVMELGRARAAELTLYSKPGESGDLRLLRSGVFSALALEAEDAGVRERLGRLGRAALGLARDEALPKLASDLYEVALGVAVQQGGRPIIERAIETLVASNDGLERGRLLRAIAMNRDPAWSPLVLELALGDRLRNNERAVPILGQVFEPATREVSFAWVQEHFDALASRFGEQNSLPLVQTAAAFCSDGDADRARAFFEPRVHRLLGGPRALSQALESVEACAAFSRAHSAAARAYFVGLEGARGATASRARDARQGPAAAPSSSSSPAGNR